VSRAARAANTTGGDGDGKRCAAATGKTRFVSCSLLGCCRDCTDGTALGTGDGTRRAAAGAASCAVPEFSRSLRTATLVRGGGDNTRLVVVLAAILPAEADEMDVASSSRAVPLPEELLGAAVPSTGDGTPGPFCVMDSSWLEDAVDFLAETTVCTDLLYMRCCPALT